MVLFGRLALVPKVPTKVPKSMIYTFSTTSVVEWGECSGTCVSPLMHLNECLNGLSDRSLFVMKMGK